MTPQKFLLKNFISGIDQFYNIERKKILFPIMNQVREHSFQSPKVYKSMGEDSAAIFFGELKDNLVLMTTDAINEDFSNKAPWSAGFCSILVGIEDIFACGGTPLAASVIISSDSENTRSELMQGIIDATHKFEIPLVRGHTSDITKNTGVSATVIGSILKEYYISAGGAKVGDTILVIADFDGIVAQTNKYYWDTVTNQNPAEIKKRFTFMNQLGESHLADASKDISNGGILGTLLLMLEYSKKGAVVHLDSILIPPKLLNLEYSLLDYCKMYLTTAFLLAIPPKNLEKIKKLAVKYSLSCSAIGEVTDGSSITLAYGTDSQKLWDWTAPN
jgi:selenophosphate synthetase-related protein